MLIGYARCSTVEQNVALQLDALKDCDKVFVDYGSGADNGRPELCKALAYAQKGDTIVVWRLDRLARSMDHLINISVRLQRDGIDLKSITENIDTTTPTGKLVFHVIAAIAEFERAIIRERINAGIKARKARGLPNGRKAKHAPEAIDALQGMTKKEMAEALGVDRSTVNRYLKQRRAPLIGQPADRCSER